MPLWHVFGLFWIQKWLQTCAEPDPTHIQIMLMFCCCVIRLLGFLSLGLALKASPTMWASCR